MIFRFKYDEAVHGARDRCIPAQLQLLFARMAVSKHAVLRTSELTTSFGWDAAVHFQQHDVQELLRVLLEALDLSTGSDEVQSLVSHDLSSTLAVHALLLSSHPSPRVRASQERACVCSCAASTVVSRHAR